MPARTIRSSARPVTEPEIFTIGHRNTLGLAAHPRDRPHLATRDGPEWRRRAQRTRARRQLWLAAGELRAHVPRTAAVAAAATAKAIIDAGGVLGAIDLHIGACLLHERSIAEMEGRRVRRRHALRGNPEHRATRTHSCSTRIWKSFVGSRCCWSLRQRIRDVRQGPDGFLVPVDGLRRWRVAAHSNRRRDDCVPLART